MSVYSINLPNDSPEGVFVLCDSTLPLKIDSPVSVAVIEEEEEDEDEDNSELKFYLARRKLMATMVVRNTVRNGKCYKEYVVLAGSQVNMSHKVLNSDKLNKLRRRAIKQGLLYPELPSDPMVAEKHPPQIYRCQLDFAFSSPSAAATFVAGSACNGKILWVTANGYTLGEIFGSHDELAAEKQDATDATTVSEIQDDHNNADTTKLGQASEYDYNENTGLETSSSSGLPLPKPDSAQDMTLAHVVFSLRKKSIQFIAQMVVHDGKYVVLKGSHIDLDTPIFKGKQYAKSDQKHNHERQQLLLEGAIARDDSGRYVLNVDQVFDSPSSAANFVAGGQNNGNRSWKAADGRSLGEYLDSKATKSKSN